jgi:glycerol kinase
VQSSSVQLTYQSPSCTGTVAPAAMEVVASIDQGTQSTRVFLFDRSTMQPVAHHQVSFPQIHPHPG